jgi:acetylornithine deacetylase/succinyl-diaminopimelate desuccinylase-like protein
VLEQLRHFVAARTPPSLRARVVSAGEGSPAVLLPRDHPAITAAARAVEQIWEQPPVFTRSGGAIGPAAALHHRLGMPVILLGFGLPSDNVHAPNERLFLPNFFRGVETIVQLLAIYGAAQQP